MTYPTTTGPGPSPQPPPDGEPKVSAFDANGNPVCPGCHEGPLMFAARANSRMGVCGCPVDRRLPDVETRAEALLLLRDVLDIVEGLLHNPMCVCAGCRVHRILRGERVL